MPARTDDLGAGRIQMDPGGQPGRSGGGQVDSGRGRETAAGSSSPPDDTSSCPSIINGIYTCGYPCEKDETAYTK